MSKEPNHDYSGPALALAIGAPLCIVVADIIGRIRNFFISEWPYISWGLLIILSATAIGWIFVQFTTALSELDSHLKEKITAIEDSIKCERNTAGHRSNDVERWVNSLNKKLDQQQLSYETLAKQVDELLSQKGPISSLHSTEPTSPIVQDAIEEIVEGLA